MSAIAALEPEAVCICAYGALIKEPLLSEHELLNVHPSLLPRWRGAAPDRAGDRGGRRGDRRDDHAARPPSWTRARSASSAASRSSSDDDYGALAARLAVLGGELLVEALDTPPPFREQPDQGVTLRREDRPRRPPARPAAARRRSWSAACARSPRTSAPSWSWTTDERLGVRRAALAAGRRGRASRAGSRWTDDRLLLGTASGALELLEVQPPAGAPWSAGRLSPRASARPSSAEAAAERLRLSASSRCPRPSTKPPAPGRNVPPAESPPCAAPTCAGRYRCVNCLRRFELRSGCPNCGAHSTIARMSDTADVECRSCGSSMLQAI